MDKGFIEIALDSVYGHWPWTQRGGLRVNLGQIAQIRPSDLERRINIRLNSKKMKTDFGLWPTALRHAYFGDADAVNVRLGACIKFEWGPRVPRSWP